MTDQYRTIFVGTLVQDGFSSIGGTDEDMSTVDNPFCSDGLGRPTLRGTGLAGALIATARRVSAKREVSSDISGSEKGRIPSTWRFFNSHPEGDIQSAFRQNVAIDPRTGASAEGALFNTETFPPGTRWPFLLEVDTSRSPEAASIARQALTHWAAGQCILGAGPSRGLGWMTLTGLQEFQLGADAVPLWPNAERSNDYPAYIKETFTSSDAVEAAKTPLPGWKDYRFSIELGSRADGYGLDSLSIGGHSSEELLATSDGWDGRYLDRKGSLGTGGSFDPDFAIVSYQVGGKRQPFIPGSSLRGPLRHALERLCKAGILGDDMAPRLFGTSKKSGKTLFKDAFASDDTEIRLAWLQHHAEDEFTGGAYGSNKFDRIAIMKGTFDVHIILEDADDDEVWAFEKILQLAEAGQLGVGGGQWRGHGWARWRRHGVASTNQHLSGQAVSL